MALDTPLHTYATRRAQVRLRRLDLPGAEGWAQDLQQAGDGGAGAEGGAGDTASGDGPQSTRPGSLAAVDLAAAAGGGSERPMSGSRFGFLGRRSSHAAMMPPVNGTDHSGRGGAAMAPPLLPASRLGADGPGSPRLFGGLLRSARAQSFSAATSGLIARMTGRGRAGNGNGSGNGSGAPSRMHTSNQGAEGSGDSGSAAASGGGVTIASGSVAALQGAPDGGAVPAAANAHGGGASGGVPSGGVLRSLRLVSGGMGTGAAGAGAGVMGGTPRGTSAGVAFPFTSARRLLPSWGSTGQGHSSQDVAAVVATSIPANRGGASNSSNSHPYITDADVGAAAAATADAAAAVPLPPPVSMPAAALALPSQAADTLPGGGAATAGSAAAAAAATASLVAGGANPISPKAVDAAALTTAVPVSGPGAVSGGAPSSDGPGWFPGEMLADVLHGVQEEDEAAAAVAVARAVSGVGMVGALAAAAGGRQLAGGPAARDGSATVS